MKHEFTEEYLTKKELKLEVEPLKKFVDISNFIEGENFFVISYDKITTVTGTLSSQKEEKIQKIVHKSTLDEILKKPMKFAELKPTFDAPIVAYKKGFGEFAKKYGTLGQKLFGKSNLSTKDFVIDDVFDAIRSGEFEIYQFIPNKNHFRVYKDVKGDYITDPIYLSYCDGNLDNGEYHLDELVEYLSQRNDVAFTVSKNSYSRDYTVLSCPLKGDEELISQIIEDIPSYNSEPGKDETVNVIFYPNSEQISQFMDWEYDPAKKQKIYDSKSFIVKSILGCDKFSKEPVIEEPVVPKRKFKS